MKKFANQKKKCNIPKLSQITVTALAVLTLLSSPALSSPLATAIKTNKPQSAATQKDVADILHSLQNPTAATQAETPHIPDQLGEITIFGQETLKNIIETIYGPHSYNELNIAKIQQLNPQLLDPNLIEIGSKLKLPTLPVTLPSNTENLLWIRLQTVDNFQDAYQNLRIYEGRTPPLFIIPSWNDNGTFNFSILLEESFSSEAEVKKKLGLISQDAFPNVTILSGLSHDSFYYEESEEGKKEHVMVAKAEDKSANSATRRWDQE